MPPIFTPFKSASHNHCAIHLSHLSTPIMTSIPQHFLPFPPHTRRPLHPLMSIFDKKVANRHEERARKSFAKSGLTQIKDVTRVTIKIQNQIYAFSQPDVAQLPGTDTFIVFGEPKIDDLMQKLAQAQSSSTFNPQDFAAQNMGAFGSQDAEEEEADNGEPEDEEGLDQEEIESIVSQTGVSRNKAVRTLKKTGTVVDAILELSQ